MFKLLEPAAGRNYAAILASTEHDALGALETRAVAAAFVRYGALLFRGFRLELDDFSAFTRQFCDRFVRNESGRRAVVSPDGTTQTVNIGQQAFPLHPELSRVPWRPDVAWFACASPPTVGGETLLCDGVAAAAALPAQTRAAVEHRGLLYTEETPLEAFRDMLGVATPSPALLERLSASSPFRFTARGGRYFRSFVRPFLHRPLFTDEPALGNFLLFARYMLNTRRFPVFEDGSEVPDALCKTLREVTDALTVAHRWQVGDILMVDNSRFMHGRNEVTDLEERVIWTRFGYARFAPPDRVAGEHWRQTDDLRVAFFGPDATAAAAAG
jgi:alpha-ketoglutarate-dependent taurine dioxygenase